MDRRVFLKNTAAAAGGVAQAAPAGKMVGIQVGAVSFVDEGVDRVLDVFQERAQYPVHGVPHSRQYSEMQLANRAGAGDAIKALEC